MSEREIEALQRAQDDINKRMVRYEENQAELIKTLKPISDVFDNVNGFGSVSILILKALALLGMGIGIVYAFINWLRR